MIKDKIILYGKKKSKQEKTKDNKIEQAWVFSSKITLPVKN